MNFLWTILVGLMLLSSSCNNPSGGSVIAQNHDPLLKMPGAFKFSKVTSITDGASLSWTKSERVATYKVFMGTLPNQVNTEVTECSPTSTTCNISNLNLATTYYFNVQAINQAGTKDINAQAIFESVGSFSITSSQVDDAKINLTWSNSLGATSYNVHYGNQSGSYSVNVKNVTSPYSLTGLTNGVTYFVRLEAVNNKYGSILSMGEISGKPFGRPGTPNGLVATATPGQVELNWNSVAGASSYKLFKGSTSGNLSQVASNLSSPKYTDTAVTNGSTYFYAVYAYNGYDSYSSAEVSARPIASFSMNSVAVGPGSMQLTITWPATVGATSYDIIYGTNFTNMNLISSNITSPFILSDLSGTSTYYFKIVAKNSVGQGTSQESTNLLFAMPIAPVTAPISLAASATPGQISLNWPLVMGASSYEIFRGTTSGSYTSLHSGVVGNSFTDTTITNGINYFYVVRSYNGLNSDFSPEAAAKAIETISITNLATTSPTSFQASWTTAIGADSYDLLYGTVSGTYSNTVTGVTTPNDLSGLKANTTYYVVIRGKNSVGAGTFYQSAQAQILTKTAAPTGLVTTSTPGKVNLNWNSVAGANNYSIYRGTTSGSYSLLTNSITTNSYVDSSVINGTDYFYVVTASNGTESANSNESTSKPISTFALTSVTSESTTSLSVNWTSALGADSYNILYGTSSGNYTTTLTNKTSPFTLTGVSPGTTYYVRVVAKNIVGNGSSQNSFELSSLTPVSPPAGLVASAAAGSINLTWTSVPNASSYKIYRGTASGVYTLIASNNVPSSYTDSSTVTGTPYYYVIKSYNGSDSPNSSEVSAKTLASIAISSINILDQNSVQVTFPSITGAETYDLSYGTSSGSYSTTQTAVSSPYIISGLTENTTYYIIVKAKNTTGSGTQTISAEMSVKTLTAPAASLVATATSTQTQLSWATVTGASSYKIYRGTVSGTYTLLASGIATTTYNDSTVTNGVTYYYAVKAFNGADSAYSNEASASPIQSFTISLAALSNSQLQVSWVNPTGASSFDVLYGTTTGSYTTTLSNKTSPLTITGLTTNKSYYVIVKAKNTIGGGAIVNSPEVTMKTPTNAPGSFAATFPSGGQVSLSWAAVTGATGYKIFRGASTGVYAQIGTTTAPTVTYLDTTVVSGTTYFYAVKATNGSDSAYSTEITLKPIASFTLSAPVAASSTAVNLTWTAAAGATSYEVRYGTTTGVYLGSVTGVTSPYSLTGLNANTTYYFAIRASNTVYATTTVSSNEMNVRTPTTAPINFSAAASAGQVQLGWDAVSGATSYRIYRGTTSGTYTLLASGITLLSYTDSTITDGTQYYYVVRSFNGSESVNSSELMARSIASFTVASTAPTNSSIQLTWASPAGAQTFDVRYGTASGIYTTLSNVTSPYTITGLSENTLYYLAVRANNSVGSGSSRQTIESTQRTPTAAPTSLISSATPGAVSLNWASVVGATSYKVYRGTTSGTYSLLATSIVGLTYSDATVSNGTIYYYVIKASNGADSADSNETTIRPISNFTLTSADDINDTSVLVTWPSVSGATSYDIRYGTSPGIYTDSLSNQVSPATINGLTKGTIYYVNVVAQNAVGQGSTVYSNELSVTSGFGAPTALTANATPGSVALSWHTIVGATIYKIFRSTTSGSYSQIATVSGASTYTDSTVTNGTTYYYVVQASDGTLDSDNSNEASVKPIATGSISSLNAISASGLTINWASVIGADSYDLRWGTVSGSYSQTILNISSPYVLTGLSANTTYYFSLRAKNIIGSGTIQNSIEASAKTSTSAPTTLAATATTGQIALAWTAATGATNYNVYRGTTTGVYTQIASAVATSTYTDSTITNGTIYYYAVKASNGSESAYSNEALAQSVANFAITSTTAPTTTTLQVTWPTTAGASAYDIRYGTTSGSYTLTATGVTSPYTLTGLSGGTNYYLVVKARNAIGLGSSSQTAQVTQATPLAAPTGLVAASTSGNVALSWTAVSGATNYNVYRGTVSGSYTLLASAVVTNSYADSTAANGTTYFYVVKAFNGAETSASNEVTTKPIASFSIASISSPTSTSILVNWNPTSGATTYDVRYGLVSGTYTTTLTGVTSPYTITGLTAGTIYYVVVRANNTIGLGTTLTSTVSTQKTALTAPTGLTASGTPGSIGLNWTAVSGATNYNIYRGTVSGTRTLLATGVASTAYMDTTVTDGTTYFYTVRAFNGSDSADSTQISLRSISSFSLTAASAASSTSILLNWGSATGAATYDVRYGTSSGVYLWTAASVTSPYSLTGLTAGTTYYISIQAKNAIGTGVAFNSNELNAKTALTAPSTLSAAATPSSVALSWTAVSGATNYNLYRGTTSGSYSQIASGVTPNAYTDSTVTDGVIYYYVVRAFNGIESANSNEVSVKPIANFSLATISTSSASTLDLTFSATGAETYNISYGTVSGSYSTTLLNKTSPYSITGLNASTRYYVVVRAKNAVGGSTTLNSSEINAVTANAAPSTLAASTTPGQANLTWSIVPGATSYNLYRGTISGIYTLLSAGISATNYQDSTIINGEIYYYVLRAYNGSESANSNEVATSAIQDFTIDSTSALSASSISVAWSNVSGATLYDVRYGTSPGIYTVTKSSVTSPYTITGLTAGTLYYIVVKAKNTVGSGSSTTSEQVTQITPVAAPTGLVATASADIVNLSWTLVSGATSYKIYRGTTSGSYAEIASGISGNTYSDSNVTNGTTYYYALKSFNDADSATSLEVFKQPIASASISSANGNLSSTSVQIIWNASAGASSYDINYGTSSGTYTSTVSNTVSPQTISGLTAGQTYYFRVVAKNTIGGGTTVNGAETSAAPNSPPALSVIGARTMEADTVSTVSFTLNDSNNILTCNGAMSASSSDPTIIQNSSIVFGGTLPNCVATLTPEMGKTGTTSLTFSATDGISITAQTFNVTVNPCTVASIVWETQPTGMAAGDIFGTAPRVSLRQANNTLCTNNLNQVVLEVSNDPSPQQDAAITSFASTTPVGGYALFDKAKMERAGVGMTVVASQDGVSSLDSNSFSVTPLSASKIIFAQQPLTSNRSVSIYPAPQVRIADAFENYLTTDNVSVTLSLQDNTEGATLGGLLTQTTTLGVATFSNLTIDTLGSYYLKATPASTFASINSDFFDVRNLIPQNAVSIVEQLQGPITGMTGNRKTFNRSSVPMGSNFIDGTVNYSWKIIATNTSSTQASTVRLLIGTTSVASITVPANTTTPTLFTTTVSNSSLTASANWTVRLELGAPTVYSSRIITKQLSANKAQVYIPLTSMTNTSSSAVSTNSTTMTIPSDLIFSTYAFNKSKFSTIDSALLVFSGFGTGGNACVALYNKTTNSMIGTELCTSATSESMLKISIPTSSLPASADIEVRMRASAGTASLFKAGLLLRLAGIKNIIGIQRIAAASLGLISTTNFVEQRSTSYVAEYGSAIVHEYLRCEAKANISGSGSFTFMDHATATSGTSSASTIAASTNIFSSQSSYTNLEAGPIGTTNGNSMFMNFNYGTGNFSLSHCLMETEASY